MKGKSNILVVDDEGIILTLFDRVLAKLSYKPVSVESGEEALKKMEERKFDIVFLDIKLPGINGVETLRRIKEVSPKSRVVMMTGYAMEKEIDEALNIGAISCLRKPLQIKDIIAIIDMLERLKNYYDC